MLMKIRVLPNVPSNEGMMFNFNNKSSIKCWQFPFICLSFGLLSYPLVVFHSTIKSEIVFNVESVFSTEFNKPISTVKRATLEEHFLGIHRLESFHSKYQGAKKFKTQKTEIPILQIKITKKNLQQGSMKYSKSWSYI